MFAKATLVSILAALCAVSSVTASSALTRVTGANGVNGLGLAMLPTTSGNKVIAPEQGALVIRDSEIASGLAGPCGRTPRRSALNVTMEMQAAVAAGLASASSDGIVSMTLYQIGRPGAGPYSCGISADGTGKQFVAMDILSNVPGLNSASGNKNTAFPLVARMAAGTKCTGGPKGNACLVRCRNGATDAGPFGGCVAVTNAVAGQGATSPGTKCARSEVSLEEADAALAEDLYKRALKVIATFEQKKRNLKSRIVGAAKAGQWI
ncbi:hypothetical protein FRC10_011365 [Ceratobasidium sp. 414]|nr:hypothetical protein FRC10_011365 [Ceratobasidium sp. 414]